MNNNFYAMILRMKYINRWGLMRNTRNENLCEHSLDVAIIAHGLTIIHNNKFGGDINEADVVLMAIYHDASEILTGDMPTPIKYYDNSMIETYKNLEKKANKKLLEMLPEFMRPNYMKLFNYDDNDRKYLIIKSADKISAYIKCLEEEQLGNNDFSNAKNSIRKYIDNIRLPEVDYFMEKFIPSFYLTID